MQRHAASNAGKGATASRSYRENALNVVGQRGVELGTLPVVAARLNVHSLVVPLAQQVLLA